MNVETDAGIMRKNNVSMSEEVCTCFGVSQIYETATNQQASESAHRAMPSNTQASIDQTRLSIPPPEIQSYVSYLLAAYAGASVVSSVPAGWIADRAPSRRLPFLCGLAALLAATVMLAFGRTLGVLFAARVLQGVSAAVVWTVGLAMVLDTVGPGNLGKVVGSVRRLVSAVF